MINEKPFEYLDDVMTYDDYDDYPMEYLEHLHKSDKDEEDEQVMESRRDEATTSTTTSTTTTTSKPTTSNNFPMTKHERVAPPMRMKTPRMPPVRQVSAGFVDSWHSDPKIKPYSKPLFFTSKRVTWKKRPQISFPYHPFSGFYHKNKFNQ